MCIIITLMHIIRNIDFIVNSFFEFFDNFLEIKTIIIHILTFFVILLKWWDKWCIINLTNITGGTLMLIKAGNYLIDVDLAATKGYYSSDMVNDCSCYGCENFRACAPHFDARIKDFFISVGIEDMGYIAEIIPYNTEPDGRVFYGGFYHICGNIIERPEAYEPFEITDDFGIWFDEDCARLSEDFPRPALQIEISTKIDWVIDKPNTY